MNELHWSVNAAYDSAAARVPEHSLVRLITERRSIRRFRNKPLDDSILSQLLETVRYAPTGLNRQNLRYIVLRKKLPQITKLVIQDLSDRIDEHALRLDRDTLLRILKDATVGYDSLFYAAPAVIVILDCFGKQVDGGIAAAHIVLLAQTMGLGTCINGIFPKLATYTPAVLDALAIPSGFGIVTSIAIGYPDLQYMNIPPRKNPEIIWA
ncbi:MAG: nitroreductase family protein [Clostridia bacterium]